MVAEAAGQEGGLRMRTAILTVHKAPNCGAMLQAWALKTVLERMGHSVEFPSCNGITFSGRQWPYRTQEGLHGYRKFRDWWRTRRMNAMSVDIFRPAMVRYDDFRRRHLPERNVEPADFARFYDVAVFGSDQIWNQGIMGDDSALFLGETLPSGLRAMSYAASLGDRIPEGAARDRLLSAVRRFDAVSVREDSAADLLAPALGARPPVVIDPALLLDAGEYAPLAAPSRPQGRYLYVYTLFFVEDLWRKAKSIAKRMGLELVYTPLHHYTGYKMPKGVTYGVSPERFIDLMAHADCVLSGSFHGTVFAFLNAKPFVSLGAGGSSRVGGVLRALGLSDRQMTYDAPVETLSEALSAPVSEAAFDRLAELRRESLGWLESALGGSR